MIDVKNLTSYYTKGIDVIEDINFKIDDSGVLVILGKNGSGKSTILKSILGLITPKCGEVLVDGINIHKISPKERAKKVSYVSQNSTLPFLSVFETVMASRLPYYNLYPSENDKNIVLNILEELNILNLKDKKASELSGGEAQIVSIARALSQEANIIIFDEPTSNLDIGNLRLLVNLIRKNIKNKKFLSIIAMHDLDVAYELGDYFLFIKEGKVISFGDKNTFNEDNIYKTFGEECLIKEIDGIRFIKFKDGDD